MKILYEKVCYCFHLQVVAVWEYNRRQLRVKQCLYGHTAAVTCLAASPAYNVIVSGSRDCSVIVWDLSRLIFVRQLRGHSAPIAAVAINEITVSFLLFFSLLRSNYSGNHEI